MKRGSEEVRALRWQLRYHERAMRRAGVPATLHPSRLRVTRQQFWAIRDLNELRRRLRSAEVGSARVL